MAISYDKKIMECVLRSVMSEGNVAQGKAIKSICKSPKPLFITGRAGTGKSFFHQAYRTGIKKCGYCCSYRYCCC